MSTSLLPIKDLLKDNVKFYRQRTPIIYPYSDEEYLKMVIKGAKTLYVDAGYTSWDDDYEENLEDEKNLIVDIKKNLSLVEKEYILVSAEIAFWNTSLSDYNTILSFSTDALSVTGSGNVGKLISETIARLTSKQTELFYKLPSYINTMSPISHVQIPKLNVTYE